MKLLRCNGIIKKYSIMKTKFQNVLCVALCIVFFVSCSSKDDDTETPNSIPVGAWELTSLVIESSFDFNGDGTSSRDLVAETDCYDGDFIDIMADGTTRIVSGLTFISVDNNLQPTFNCRPGFDRTTTWTQSDNQIVVENGLVDIVGTISGNTITAVITNGFEIEKLNGTTVEDDFETMTLTYVKLNSI